MLSSKEVLLLKRIEEDVSYHNWFFKEAKDLKWFYPLNDRKYFNPKGIKYDDNGNALFWNVLDYLERVSEQVTQNPEYGPELINIIDSVVRFSLNQQKINNHHIWWYCAKILNNLPADVIKKNLDAEKFHTWLSVWAEHSLGSDLITSDIGEKLLPKFLSEDFGPDYKYAEIIIDSITEIRAGGRSPGSLTNREDVVLARDAYWIQESFKKNYQEIGKKCSLQVVFLVADRLKKALEYKWKVHHEDIDIGSDVYRIEVSRIPQTGLTAGEIGFEDKQYSCAVKRFSPDQIENVDRAKDIWGFYNIKPQYELKRFTFDALNKKDMVSVIKQNLPAGILWTNVKELEAKLGYIFDGLYSDYSSMWFKSLAGGREHANDAEEVLTTILRDVLIAKCAAKRFEGKQVVVTFLSDKYPFMIFKRFVLFCIDKFWEDYAGLLNIFFDSTSTALEKSDFEVELYDILRNHNADFSSSLKTRLKDLISDIPEYYVKEGERSTAFWKYKWLSPLRENPDFLNLYEETKQEFKPKDGKPYEPERSTFKGGFIGYKSPISREDILQKPILELVKYLNEFKGADNWQRIVEDEPDREGLAEAFQSAVKENPKKFTDEIDVLSGLDYFYLYRVFRGLGEAWKADKELDWERIFNFLLKYLERNKNSILKEVFQSQGESGKGRYIWIIDTIVELIADGSENGSRVFAPEYFDKAERVFDLITPLLKGEKHPDTQRDALTYALNTTLGRTIRAYITFALRVARNTQNKEENWGQKKYERFFPVGVDAYIWFGCYLPQMKYLDEKYAKEKIEFFAQKPADDFEWIMFMEGYLAAARVYKDVYFLMRPNYLKVLKDNAFAERIDQRLVEHISIGYLQEYELLQQNNGDGQASLFWKMLMEVGTLGKRNRWLEVADFFWSLTERTIKKEDRVIEKETSGSTKNKILEFWAWTYVQQDLVKTNLGDDYDSFLGKMAQLTILLDKIDEEKEKWLLLCAPNIDNLHGASATFFIEYLTKFDDEESVGRIGKIFLKILENTTPTYRQEDIELIVRRVYDKGDQNDADAICNTYGRRGIHFLKPIWEERQKGQ